MNNTYRQRQTRRIYMPQTPPYSSMTQSQLNDLPLAMAYVPRQEWKDIYDLAKGLNRGTIFAQLDLPFGGAL